MRQKISKWFRSLGGESQPQNWGIALGGGAARGIAHTGVLQFLEEKHLKPAFVTGTSAGALVGALYAFGKSPKEILDLARELTWMQVSGFSLSRYGILSNEELAELITEQLGEIGFEDAPIPFACIATDITTGKGLVLDKGPVAEAVRASAAVPGIYIPVTINERMLVDGGVVENVPISPLKSMGAEFILGVDLNGNDGYEEPGGVIDILLNAFDIAVDTTTRIQTQAADVLIRMNLASYSRTDSSAAEELFEAGYKAAQAQWSELEHLQA
ncbi:MAG: patatin-like phospholipase family protein [Candidatus Marinimicrobia bacterium]|nr:patatin-like phospholipase family protein [Candidatus Neomarinimicrobiota bacterium]